MSIVGVEAKTKNRNSCRSESSGTILCMAEENSVFEIAEVTHPKTDPFQDFRNVYYLVVLRIGNDAVVLLTTGIALELVQREYLRQFSGFVIYASEIAHSSHTGYIVAQADLLGGHYLFKGVDDFSHQPAGDTVVAGQECVVLKETLAAATAVAALPKVQEGISCQRNILDRLHPIVVYMVCDRAADRTSMLFSGKLYIDVEFLRNILHIRDNYVFQIQKLCCIILIEHRDFSFRIAVAVHLL